MAGLMVDQRVRHWAVMTVARKVALMEIRMVVQ